MLNKPAENVQTAALVAPTTGHDELILMLMMAPDLPSRWLRRGMRLLSRQSSVHHAAAPDRRTAQTEFENMASDPLIPLPQSKSAS